MFAFLDFIFMVEQASEIQIGPLSRNLDVLVETQLWNIRVWPVEKYHSDSYYSFSLTPLREFTMLSLMDALTDKPQWEEKVSINLFFKYGHILDKYST